MTSDRVIIGRVTEEVLSMLSLSYGEKEIVLWKDRIKYLDKHRADFSSDEAFEKHIKLIPQIIEKPDYVGLHPKGDSIQYIKRIDELMLVAVRISNNKNWAFRSSYPISQETFDTYIASGSVKRVDEDS
ncbi:hypothetical protein VK70_14510 [Paenibacillus durus ATCC 35681]|uniref:Phage-Barnase-EndoU-ColicinE5/D-RelE like nuclease 3 domain-containing protein n=2 Tax=Paenibacillus durus TaxID=44251 RepID=A0A0F7FFE1_PAEDU|nr:hypothetical protein VK70_14510 [Paenibacillus durus ATCC 35681]